MSGRRHPLAARPELCHYDVFVQHHISIVQLRLHPRCPVEGARSVGVYVRDIS